jgi:hypothetical protein
METLKKLLRALSWFAVGMVVLVFVAGKLLSPSESEVQAARQQVSAKTVSEEEASRERVRAKLQAELSGNRDAIIAEAKARIERGDFLSAQQYVERFRTFNDPELVKIADLAKTRHEAAERERQARDNAIQAAALKSMVKRTDKIDGIDWYRDRSSPAYNNRNGFFIYIGKRSNSSPWLRLRAQYHAEDWLFIRGFVVVADDQRFERGPVVFERDNDSKIWEWYDADVDATDLNLLNAVANSKQATIRFNGQQYRSDRTISAAEKTAIRNVLNAYRSLGGK